MKKLLVVMPCAPAPPRSNGIALRYFPLLSRLTRDFDVDLAVVDSGSQEIELGALESKLKRVISIRRNCDPPKLSTRLAAQIHRVLPFGIPYELIDYGARDAAEALKEVIRYDYDAILWVSLSETLQRCIPYIGKSMLLLDGIDCRALHYRRTHSRDMSLYRRFRAWRFSRWESALLRSARHCLYVSPVDAGFARNMSGLANISVSPNGIFLEDYTDASMEISGPTIGYLGNMSYAPNEVAVLELYEIFKRLRRKIPDLKMYVIGRGPTLELMAACENKDVIFTGEVENIWPFVNAIDLFVLPLVTGTGQQNKVLEILYAERPVVCTTIANGGIGAKPGIDLIVADGRDSQVEMAYQLFLDRDRRIELAKSGRRFVTETFVWDSVYAGIKKIIERACGDIHESESNS